MSMNELPKNDLPENEPPENEVLDRFERQLRGLRPAAPRELRIPRYSAPWGVVAFAAILLAVIGVGVMQWRSARPARRASTGGAAITVAHNSTVMRPITVGQLNAAWRASDQDLNQLMDSVSPRLLPREHRGTALYELGKE